MFLFILVVFSFSYVLGHRPCAVLTAEYGSVCVCNATYCDTFPELVELSEGEYQLITTSSENLGFSSTVSSFSESSSKPSNTIKVNTSEQFQTIIGFGGAFTDSAGINILNLPEKAQENLLESYFGRSGIEYNLCRVPVRGTDFSLEGYTYCDTEDATLKNFKLQSADFTYKIPLIQKAQQLRNNLTFNLFASAWTAPPWMKTNNDYAGFGWLKREYYQVWADYFIKFFDAYKDNNITFWGMTTQNEPMDGIIPSEISVINSMGWLPTWMNEWVVGNLGPTLKSSTHKNIKILIHDDNRFLIPVLHFFSLTNESVLQYIDGVGVHVYSDFFTPPFLLNYGKSDKKDLILIATEACEGFIHIHGLNSVKLGSWERGSKYANYILDDIEHDVSGWVDWNMALDLTGGPTYINNNVDASVIVNATAGEFYKQPMFYVQGHFSKLVLPGSVRVGTSVDGVNDLRALAFLRPDNKVALVIHNNVDKRLEVQVEISGSATTIDIEALSINTVLYPL